MSRELIRAIIIAGLAMSAAACASYPTEPQFSTRPTPVGVRPVNPVTSPEPAPVAPPPVVTAPIASVEGGALAPAGGALPPALPLPSGAPSADRYAPPPPGSAAAAAATTSATIAGNAYVIQPGDTISGVGRRFRTPIQTLIDLNGLGPSAAIRSGQQIILPDTARDGGVDPYATGPSPTAVFASNEGLPPPPPPPASTRPGAVSPPSPAPVPAPAPIAGSSVALDWPVRGDILRRFGPTGMGSRNNGINIGAAEGEPVLASASGRVAYVGENLPGQGLTVLVVHRDGWRTTYGHLGRAMVREGEEVSAREQIGTVGTTAGDGRPSIHFEIWRMRGDEPTAQDPLAVLPR